MDVALALADINLLTDIISLIDVSYPVNILHPYRADHPYYQATLSEVITPLTILSNPTCHLDIILMP